MDVGKAEVEKKMARDTARLVELVIAEELLEDDELTVTGWATGSESGLGAITLQALRGRLEDGTLMQWSGVYAPPACVATSSKVAQKPVRRTMPLRKATGCSTHKYTAMKYRYMQQYIFDPTILPSTTRPYNSSLR
ncbi:hypothetical protein LTR56_026832 [Elasticomyces elasticus]|nr:hypothetical protein LTR56_026832 [Elasticomyces elasticus]KAK3617117.1 hypothetical protein LTR22_026835 [Elasticomyces elasticus]KAK4899576.1 hypothetical protein LTR49_027634 [Elasticomyces elasticus]KAK5735412.1 hypothetical protein LTS12_026467 [Elasticomyces elasticus]